MTIYRTHNGFGDVIYYRPVVEAMCEKFHDVVLACAWPEMLDDLPVEFIPAISGLTWSLANQRDQKPSRWADVRSQTSAVDIRINRARRHLKTRSMIDLMAEVAKVKVNHFSLPPNIPSPRIFWTRPMAVIRPVTHRTDWKHTARMPEPGYMQQAAAILRDAGYWIISLGGVSDSEPYLGEPPFAHERYDHGELGPLELLGLVRGASVVVTAPGWAVPAALACRTPLVVIAGGAGGTNGPVALVPSWYDGSVSWIKPDKFCMCGRSKHDCTKTISNFADQFAAAIRVEVAA